MAIFASTTLGSSDPMRAQSIKALEARAQQLQQAQAQQQAPTSLPSPWQGAGYLANTLADAVNVRRADQAAAQRRQDLQGYISNLGDNPTMAQLGPIMAADTDVGKAIMAEIQQRRMAAQKTQDDLAYLQKQQDFQAAQPQSPLGKLTADIGRKPTEEEAQAEIKKMTMGSPADQAAIGKAKDENINLQTTNAQLDEADKLLESGKVYSGAGGGLRTDYGQAASAIGLGGIAGTTPEQNAASQRYKQILSSEVVQTLKALKGPASNKDMDWATSTVNDPSAPLENKKAALKILRAQMAAHLASSEQTLKGMGAAPVKVDIPTGGGGDDAAARAWLADPANANSPHRAGVEARLKGGR